MINNNLLYGIVDYIIMIMIIIAWVDPGMSI
jgi:hypothetical protein